MHKRFPLVLGLFSFALLSTLIGCGPSRGDLAGKVTYKGEILKYGTVLVQGGNGEPKQSPISTDGTYNIKGVVAGTVKIAVSSPDPTLSQAKGRKRMKKSPK